MARLTKRVREQILDQNEGFSRNTYISQRNFTEDRTYTIRGGKLYIRTRGKSSWGGSRYDREYIASEEETHRFLYKYQNSLNTDGIA